MTTFRSKPEFSLAEGVFLSLTAMEKDFRFLMYHSDDGNISVNAVVKDDTVWLTQKGMAELFGVETPAISNHLANIYSEGELQSEATVSKMEIVKQEGTRNVRRMVDFYNLDAIISVGYRVNSRRANHFRIWATGILKEYMIKGFALYDDRLFSVFLSQKIGSSRKVVEAKSG